MWARFSLDPGPTPVLGSKVVPGPRFYDVQDQVQHQPALPASREVQEALVLEDLLAVLAGSEGNHIRFSPDFDPYSPAACLAGPEYKLSRHIDLGLQQSLADVLLAAKYSYAITAAAQELSSLQLGRVNHALGAGFRAQISEFRSLVAAMASETAQNDEWTLHDLNMYVKSVLAELEHGYGAIQALVNEANSHDNDDENAVHDESQPHDIKMSTDARPNLALALADVGAPAPRPVASSDSQMMFPKGGAALRVLIDRLNHYSGSPSARKVLSTLIIGGSRPYMEILRKWLDTGVIDDPFDEFMIQETSTKGSLTQAFKDYADEYWQDRYVLRGSEEVPRLLATPEVADQVLQAGKYLNVIRECGGGSPVAETLVAAQDKPVKIDHILDGNVLPVIYEAHERANSALLKLLFDQFDLRNRLVSFKRAFFGTESDFMPRFLESVAKELEKPVAGVARTKIQYALDLAIVYPGSISGYQPYLEGLIVNLASTSILDELLSITSKSGISSEHFEALAAGDVLYEPPTVSDSTPDSASSSLTGISALKFDFDIPFPLSLVLTRSAIYRYQFLFRHLLGLGDVQRTLEAAWLVQNKAAVWKFSGEDSQLRAWKGRAQLLRLNMQSLFSQLYFYSTVVVIEYGWVKFFSQLDKASTVDGLRAIQLDFLDESLKSNLLMSPPFLTTLGKLLKVGRMYGEFLQAHNNTLAQIDPSVLNEKELSQHVPIMTDSGEPYTAEQLMAFLEATLDRYEGMYSKYVRAFLTELNNDMQHDNADLRMLLSHIDGLV